VLSWQYVLLTGWSKHGYSSPQQLCWHVLSRQYVLLTGWSNHGYSSPQQRVIIVSTGQVRLCDVYQQVKHCAQVPALLSSTLSLQRLGRLQ
jgi:hypothetical protein